MLPLLCVLGTSATSITVLPPHLTMLAVLMLPLLRLLPFLVLTCNL